jgi:hypothetical protein
MERYSVATPSFKAVREILCVGFLSSLDNRPPVLIRCNQGAYSTSLSTLVFMTGLKQRPAIPQVRQGPMRISRFPQIITCGLPTTRCTLQGSIPALERGRR